MANSTKSIKTTRNAKAALLRNYKSNLVLLKHVYLLYKIFNKIFILMC